MSWEQAANLVLLFLLGVQAGRTYRSYRRYRAARQARIAELAKWNAERLKAWPGVAKVLAPEGMRRKDCEELVRQIGQEMEGR